MLLVLLGITFIYSEMRDGFLVAVVLETHSKVNKLLLSYLIYKYKYKKET